MGYIQLRRRRSGLFSASQNGATEPAFPLREVSF